MSAVGDIATKYKLDAAIPQLLTVPIPGPASGRYAGVKTGEEIVDLMEKAICKTKRCRRVWREKSFKRFSTTH